MEHQHGVDAQAAIERVAVRPALDHLVFMLDTSLVQQLDGDITLFVVAPE